MARDEVRQLRYCLIRPDARDPVGSVSRVLAGSGVRVARVDRRDGRVTGTIRGPDGDRGRAVEVSLFPRPDACLVEIACAANPEAVLEADLDAMRLAGDLRESLPPRNEGRRKGASPPPGSRERPVATGRHPESDRED